MAIKLACFKTLDQIYTSWLHFNYLNIFGDNAVCRFKFAAQGTQVIMHLFCGALPKCVGVSFYKIMASKQGNPKVILLGFIFILLHF